MFRFILSGLMTHKTASLHVQTLAGLSGLNGKAFICLDGGMGQTLIQRSKRPLSNLWSSDIMFYEPELVTELHAEFIAAGADVITLNTYTATPDRLVANDALDWLETLHEKAFYAAREAITASGKEDVLIAGCLPPLLASYRPDVAPDFAQSLASYQQLVALQSDCDVFLCETMSSIAEATAACTAARASGKPVWVAFSVSDSAPQQLRGGEPLSEALMTITEYQPDAVLLNCSRPEAITAALPKLQSLGVTTGAYANGFVSVESLYPGETVSTLQRRQDLAPAQYAEFAMQWFGQGARIIGGCCEVTPEHIQAVKAKLG